MPLPQFTTVPDKTLGDVFTEAMWDTYIRDNLNTLGNQPKALIYSNADQGVPNATLTARTFTYSFFDTDAMRSGDALIINTAGYYLIGGTVMWQASNAGDRWLGLQLNSKWVGVSRIGAAPSAVQTFQQVYAVRYAAAGQLIYLYQYQSSGGSLASMGAASYDAADGSSAPNLWAVRLG